MSDWKARDLALCIKTSPWVGFVNNVIQRAQPDRPLPGRIYTVDSVTIEFSRKFLFLAGFNQIAADGERWNFLASRFVKVTPPEADEFDREIIDLYTQEGEPVR